MAAPARSLAIAFVLALVGASCGDDDTPAAITIATENTDAAIESDPATTSGTPPAAPPPTATSGPSDTATPADTPTSLAPSTADPQTCGTGAGLLPVASEPARVILDTDFASDVDDVGALAVLHALADAGEAEILAVMVSDGGEAPSHRAIDAVNTFYARPDVPIGIVAGAAPAFPSTYVTELASEFPNDVQDPPAAVDLYRRILAGEPDDSVTIVSVGYLTNLDALLLSPPDEHSASSGEQLVAAKVKRWVAMGGYYPDSVDHPFDAEFNFAEDATATLNAVENWPTPAVFSGWEIGDVVLTGAVLQAQTPPENPVREAYRLFNGGEAHRSWDLTAVLAAVRGAAGMFEVCTGQNVIGRGGSNRWQDGGENPDGYLRLIVPADDVASVLDLLLIAPPGRS